MITPFTTSFQIDLFEITQDVIDGGYAVLLHLPNIESIIVSVDESNDIVYGEYSIEEVTINNSYLYPLSVVGNYVITWISQSTDTSSSSSSTITHLELETILLNKIGGILSVKYISV